MKATYQKPEIMTERVETQGLLALSNKLDIANNRVELNYESMEAGSGGDDAASKGNSFDLWEE